MASFTIRTVKLIALSLAFFGCTAHQSPPRHVKMQTPFVYSEHEPYAQPGENSIVGQGVVGRQGSGAITCAGKNVLLVPGTSYFREMVRHLVAGSEPDPPETAYPDLKNMIKKTQCDPQGKFLFPEVPDGAWFVLTEVNAKNGGVLIREVILSNHGSTTVILTESDLVQR